MNGRSDASTSTDDVKGRPLCLFYFSQPLGVLASEPPRAAPCPAHLYCAPAHMAPAWDAPWPAPPGSASACRSGSSAEPPAPPAPRPRHLPPAPPARRDTLSSSLFSSDVWLPSSASSREFPRRALPYHALLPPLRLPAPLPLTPDDARGGPWPLKGLPTERFSLPPIELPRLCELDRDEESCDPPEPEPVSCWVAPEPHDDADSRLSRRATPARRTRRAPPGVHKPRRRARASALRRTLTHLIRRSIKGSCIGGSRGASASSCCLRAALRTLRAAWAPPAPLRTRTDAVHTCWHSDSALCSCRASAPPASLAAMPRAATSPGLLRRRYSAPETVMRKYRLAQQNSESEEPCAATSPSSMSPQPTACVGCGGPARTPGDREHMRKSALLRRLWGPAPRASRSLHGSSSELRRSPAGSGWTTPKRQRLEWTEPHVEPGLSPACSDCTFASHRARSPAARADPVPRPERDVFARYSELAAAPPPRAPTRSPTDSSTSSPTAREAPSKPTPAPFVVDLEDERYASLPIEVLSAAGSPPYDVLEIVVSETVDGPRAVSVESPRGDSATTARGRGRNVNIDEYVSNILVESLNSLSEQLESMSAAVGGAGVVVEKEIKVRLQNTGVNTIVHLSPTSNHQIIFGNEELAHADNAPRDACNNPRDVTAACDVTAEPNNNEPEPAHRAVLQQIQKLFHDELYRLDPATRYPGRPAVARVEVCDVDAFLDDCDSRAASATPAAVGAGNYWARTEPALVPHLSPLPHSASMEVNTSSSEAEPSGCASLVDSLDDPASPRVPPPPLPAPRRLVRSAVDVLALLPEAPPTPPLPPRERSAAFFVGIAEDDPDCDKENVVVADRMPDKIRERLFRRHRKRELRIEHARRGRGRREADRDARAVVAALVDEFIAKIAHDELKCMRARRRPAPVASLARRGDCGSPGDSPPPEPRGLRGRLALQPTSEPRRIYQKSEIRDGDKCIEILEILEYVDDSQNSPETTNSDERHDSSKSRKSRIPIPIYERIQRTSTTYRAKRSEESRRRSPPPPSPSPPPARRASVPPPVEPRSRAGSLRFRRVFDIIPEERACTGVDSPPTPAAGRRVSAPSLPPAPATRSAATSPAPPQRAERSTMTSPRRLAPPVPPAPRPAAGSNGNSNEKRVTSESKNQQTENIPGRVLAEVGHPPAAFPESALTAAQREAPQLSREPHGEARADGGERAAARRSSSSGSDSGGSSLLCAAPRWLAARRRRSRPARTSRAAHNTLASAQPGASGTASGKVSGGAGGAGGWSVTVAGSCRAALPADVEMRLRFPREQKSSRAPRAPPRAAARDTDATPRRSVATRSDETGTTECWCRCCSCGAPAQPSAPPALPPPHSRRPSLTLTMKKEDSSLLARKSRKKSSRTHLPELEAPRGGGGGGGGGERRRHSAKMRRACSLHCWLPAAAPRRAAGDELAVEGSAIVPELKPRPPTMSERDLTRHPPHPTHPAQRHRHANSLATPRFYLRS